MHDRKKSITITLLAIIIAILGSNIITNAEKTASASTQTPAYGVVVKKGDCPFMDSDTPYCATHYSVLNKPVQRRLDIKPLGGEKWQENTYKTGAILTLTKGFSLECSLHKAEQGVDYGDDYVFLWDAHGIDPNVPYSGAVNSPDIYKGTIKWTSSNSSIASVNANGVVKGLKVGKVVITAEYDSLSIPEKMTTSFTLDVKANKYTAPIKMGTIWANDFSQYKSGKGFNGLTNMYFDKQGNLILKYTSQVKLTKRGKKYYKKLMKQGILYTRMGIEANSGKTVDYTIYASMLNGKRAKISGKVKSFTYKLANHKKAKIVTTIKINKKNIKYGSGATKNNIDLRTANVLVKNALFHQLSDSSYRYKKKAGTF